MSSSSPKVYKNLDEFFPFYLSQHVDPLNRLLHVIGTSLVVAVALYSVLTAQFKNLLFVPLIGYGFAWVGHFFFEKNRPATFTYPLLSLKGDFKMWYGVITGSIPLDDRSVKRSA